MDTPRKGSCASQKLSSIGTCTAHNDIQDSYNLFNSNQSPSDKKDVKVSAKAGNFLYDASGHVRSPCAVEDAFHPNSSEIGRLESGPLQHHLGQNLNEFESI